MDLIDGVKAPGLGLMPCTVSRRVTRRRVEVDGFSGADIAVSRGQLHYFFPESQSVRAVDLNTGDVTDLLQNVTRPGRIYFHREERQDQDVQMQVSRFMFFISKT